MTHTERAIVPRRGLRIDLALRETPFTVIGLGGAGLGVQTGTGPVAASLFALLVAVRVQISRT
ncbi:hypothetical protein [Streptomyces sp. NPDC051452]|uniref:hypothetical protein n=1 Tax=Streptomyces sp. NPDC051452 TaxID=3365654 RepID=UPI0037A0A0A9